jgi:hypothetical protein
MTDTATECVAHSGHGSAGNVDEVDVDKWKVMPGERQRREEGRKVTWSVKAANGSGSLKRSER